MNQRETILRALRSEEESFSKTLDRGLARFKAVTDALPAEGVFPEMRHLVYMIHMDFLLI